MKRFEFRLRSEEEVNLNRMIEDVKVNLRLVGIRKNISNAQAVKFILFEKYKGKLK